MTTTVKRVKTTTFELGDRPGTLAKVLSTLRNEKVDLSGLWVWSEGKGKARGILLGKNPVQLDAAVKKAGVVATTGDACLCEGTDQIGVFHDLLEKAAAAGVNLHATNAVGTAGKFAAAVWAEEGQQEKLCQALGC